MITVNEHIKALQELVKEDARNGSLPIIYSSDDEGNNYQQVGSPPTLAQVEDATQSYNIEMVGFYNGDDKDEIAKEDCNCVIIN